MKLTEVRTRDVVNDDQGAPTAHFTERNGYTLSYEQGIVTIQHSRMAAGRLVPISNVAFMVPATERPKPRAA